MRVVSAVLALALAATGVSLLRSQEPPSPAQTAPKPPGPDDVVATVNGQKLTPRMIQQLRSTFPAQFQQAIARMDSRAFLKTYAELTYLAGLGEKDKLVEKSPYKEQLALMRQNFVAQAFLDNLKTRFGVNDEDIRKYYDQNPEQFQEAHVKAIYVAFSPNAGKPPADPKAKKLLTDQQAKTKAESLVAQLKKGADFATLAKANSDDAPSAAKGGDLGVIKRNSGAIPAELKDVIFNLEPGQASDPIRQPAGFYVFRLEKMTLIPMNDVAATIASQVQGIKIQQEVQRVLGEVQITYDNPAYFNQPVEPGPALPPPPRQP